jgi:hypothetical protein
MRRSLSLILIAAVVAFTTMGCEAQKRYLIARDLAPQYQGKTLRHLYVVVSGGATYHFATAEVGADVLRGRTVEGRAMSIPIADVRYAWQTNAADHGLVVALTPLAVIGAAALGIVTVAALTSCPFVYAHDGQRYVLAAEPLGGAISRPLQRTDYVPVEQLAPSNGHYRIRLANELDETQYVDALELWAIDHPSGAHVALDTSGGIHTLGSPEPPLSAVVNGEHDALGELRLRDGLAWASDMDAKCASPQPRLRDDIEMTFRKPQGTRQAKLVLTLSHTPWATHMFKYYAAMLPEGASEWTRRVASADSSLDAIRQLVKRQGLLHVELSLWDGRQWRAPEFVSGGSPLVPHERVLVLDVADVPGDELRVRLRAAAGLWMVDRVATDFSADQAVTTTRLSPRSAQSAEGQDVAAELRASDDSYYVLPAVGSSANVEFEAPPVAAGQTRSAFVKISGYYEIHTDGPRRDKAPSLLTLLADPDAAARMSLELFRQQVRPQRADAPPAGR